MINLEIDIKCRNCSPGYKKWTATYIPGLPHFPHFENVRFTGPNGNHRECPYCLYDTTEDVRNQVRALEQAVNNTPDNANKRHVIKDEAKRFNEEIIRFREARKSEGEGSDYVPGYHHHRYKTAGIRGFECTHCHQVTVITGDEETYSCTRCGSETKIRNEHIIEI